MDTFVGRIIARLERVLDEETKLLKAKAVVDLQQFNLRKSQGLYDLSRALHRLDGGELGPQAREKLGALRRALEANQAALSVHLQAMREIAAIISDAIQEAESDGTYAPPFNRAGGGV